MVDPFPMVISGDPLGKKMDLYHVKLVTVLATIKTQIEAIKRCKAIRSHINLQIKKFTTIKNSPYRKCQYGGDRKQLLEYLL